MKDDSFVRWQKYTLDQLTYSVNLILTLSTASLGFAVALLINKDFPLTSFPLWSWGKILFLLTLLALFASMGLGIWCVINRLYDFRTTKDTARQREKGTSDEELKPLRLKYEDYGAKTWKIFWGQIGCFGFAVLTFILSMVVIYHERLF